MTTEDGSVRDNAQQARARGVEGNTTPEETQVLYFIKEYCAENTVALPLNSADEHHHAHEILKRLTEWYGTMTHEDEERFKKKIPVLMRSYLRSTKPL